MATARLTGLGLVRDVAKGLQDVTPAPAHIEPDGRRRRRRPSPWLIDDRLVGMRRWAGSWGGMEGVSALRGDDPAYEVRISGLVPPGVLNELVDVEVAAEELRTVVSGHFVDQAALYGFLHRLRDLGLDVVEVRRVVTPGTDLPGEQEP